MAIKVRKAALDDAYYLAPRLRKEDREECWAMFGMEPLVPLVQSLEAGEAWVGTVGGEPIGVYGVAPAEEGVGHPWMVATPALVAHQRNFIRQSAAAVRQLQRSYHTLTNVVDERNTVHIRWLQWCNFKFVARLPAFGFEQRPFLQFVRYAL